MRQVIKGDQGGREQGPPKQAVVGVLFSSYVTDYLIILLIIRLSARQSIEPRTGSGEAFLSDRSFLLVG